MRSKFQTNLYATSGSALRALVQALLASCCAKGASAAFAQDVRRGAGDWAAPAAKKVDAAFIRANAAHTSDWREVARRGEPCHARVAA